MLTEKLVALSEHLETFFLTDLFNGCGFLPGATSILAIVSVGNHPAVLVLFCFSVECMKWGTLQEVAALKTVPK